MTNHAQCSYCELQSFCPLLLIQLLKSSPVKVHEAWKQPSGSGCSHFVEGTEKNLVCLKNLLLFPRVSPDVGEQELDCRTGDGSAVQQDESKDGY